MISNLPLLRFRPSGIRLELHCAGPGHERRILAGRSMSGKFGGLNAARYRVCSGSSFGERRPPDWLLVGVSRTP